MKYEEAHLAHFLNPAVNRVNYLTPAASFVQCYNAKIDHALAGYTAAVKPVAYIHSAGTILLAPIVTHDGKNGQD